MRVILVSLMLMSFGTQSARAAGPMAMSSPVPLQSPIPGLFCLSPVAAKVLASQRKELEVCRAQETHIDAAFQACNAQAVPNSFLASPLGIILVSVAGAVVGGVAVGLIKK